MYTKDYVQAAYKVLHAADDQASVLLSLKKYLKSRGLEKLYPVVLRGLAEKLLRKYKSTSSKIIVAREHDLERHKSDIKNILSHFKTDAKPETRIDESIIGGFIIQGGNERIDQSYKKKLLHIYRSLID